MGNRRGRLLMDVNPKLYAELHPTLNTIDTTVLTVSTAKKAWWQCSKNSSHYWEATVNGRSKGNGCAMCAGQYVVHGVNDLSVLRPELYVELHPTMNTIDTTILSPGSNKKVWWKCSKNSSHYWVQTVYDRNNGYGCAMCAGQYVVHGVNDLSVLRPELYVELHPTMNTIDTTILSPGSNKKVWWKCSKNSSHYWEVTVNTRVGGNGCAMCAGQYVVHGVNDLSVLRPELYAELHPTMNTIDTTILSISSGKKAWWQCSKVPSHYWEALVSSRTKGHGCAMCAGQYVVHGVNDLSVLNPELYAELHPTMNTIDTTILSQSSHTKVWWQCSKNSSHYWEATVNIRYRGNGCAMCAGQYVVHGVNDLSILRPELYVELHPTMNTIDTTILSISSGKKVWWQCSRNSSHYWEATVGDRNSGYGCGMCAGQYVVHGVNDLSVLRPELYAELHPTMNTIDTTILSPGSLKKVWWQCSKNSSHYWNASLNNRTKGHNCGMCRGLYVVHRVNDLSVLNPELYAELHPIMNTVDTTILSQSSHTKVWWQCSKNSSHYWEATVNHRANGNRCPHCVTYRNESEFRALFTKSTNLEFKDGHVMGERELFKRDKIQIDMINHETGVIIEYDGAWSHGTNEFHKRTAEQGLDRDTDTTTTLLEVGYKVVRIRETPLQFLELQHENLFQVAFTDRDDKLPAIRMTVEALRAMGVGIKMKDREVNEL